MQTFHVVQKSIRHSDHVLSSRLNSKFDVSLFFKFTVYAYM